MTKTELCTRRSTNEPFCHDNDRPYNQSKSFLGYGWDDRRMVVRKMRFILHQTHTRNQALANKRAKSTRQLKANFAGVCVCASFLLCVHLCGDCGQSSRRLKNSNPLHQQERECYVLVVILTFIDHDRRHAPTKRQALDEQQTVRNVRDDGSFASQHDWRILCGASRY